MDHDASPVCYADLKSVPLRLPRTEILCWLRGTLESQMFASNESNISDLYRNKVLYLRRRTRNMSSRGLELKD